MVIAAMQALKFAGVLGSKFEALLSDARVANGNTALGEEIVDIAVAVTRRLRLNR